MNLSQPFYLPADIESATPTSKNQSKKRVYFFTTLPCTFLSARFLSFSSSFFWSAALSRFNRSSSLRFFSRAFSSSASSRFSASASRRRLSSTSSRVLRNFVRVSGLKVILPGASSWSISARQALMSGAVAPASEEGGRRSETMR